MPLQDIPQKFLFMQSWQMENPHRHRQQNGGSFLQQAQGISLALRRLSLYEEDMDIINRACQIAFHCVC